MHLDAIAVPASKGRGEGDDSEALPQHATGEHRGLRHSDHRYFEQLPHGEQPWIAERRDDRSIDGRMVLRQRFHGDGTANLCLAVMTGRQTASVESIPALSELRRSEMAPIMKDWRIELIEAHPNLFHAPVGAPEATQGYPTCSDGWCDLLERLPPDTTTAPTLAPPDKR
jgi:hypothetical protein